jgi:hypothetical protein
MALPAILQKNLESKRQKTPFFDTFDQMADAEAKIEKQLQITKIQTISQIPSEYQIFPI